MSTVARAAPQPPWTRRASDWVRDRLFGSRLDATLTLGSLCLLAWAVPPILRWAVLDARWHAATPAECLSAGGACWAVIAEKWRVLLFGTYPYEQQWRAGLATALLVALCVASAVPRLQRRWLFIGWMLGVAAAAVLLGGGMFGLPVVRTEQWNGLPLTMVLFLGSVAGGLPLAVLLAMGRRSGMPIIRVVCSTYVELLRGLPLVNVLFFASLMIPLFLPEGVTVDKLVRAVAAMALFAAANSAEVIRGGLQTVAPGQTEAARALGLGYWTLHARVVLPQALAMVLPPLVNDIVRAFKNTSFVLVIGLFDLLGGTQAAMAEPRWGRFYLEAYVFVGLIYFAACSALSAYGGVLERRLGRRA